MPPTSEDSPWVALGAFYMCLAMLAGSTIDISVKALSDSYATTQIVMLRCVFALPIALLLVHRQGGLSTLVTPRWRWQLVRGVLTAGANFAFFYGLAHVPLVTVIMLTHVSPVMIVLLSRPLLGESVGLLG
ncbi:MAG: DMT family transporter [Pseudomonadales bacterium]|nr:DMT family transporter [Pseudomonadales bacterium]MDP6472845.1 DMT family transporter [Pseudomonadales bacterium]MDP6826399.1 DMT family transporter [Pseudomonadales bacterium]MDP6972535.1 DMT family transporter [Pseudomonadales bacterium]